MSYGNLTENIVGANVDYTSLYILLVFLGILAAFGTFSNTVAVIVFAKRKDRLVATLFMLALAVADAATCSIVIPITMFMEYIGFRTSSLALCKIYSFLTPSVVPYSTFIVTAIASDRYACICHNKCLSHRNARIIIVLLCLLAFFMGGLASYVHTIENHEEKYVKCKYIEKFPVTNGNGTTNNKMCQVFEKTNITAGAMLYSSFIPYCQVDATYGTFASVYSKVHTSTFWICSIFITLLYGLLFKSVMELQKRDKERSIIGFYTQSETTEINGTNSRPPDEHLPMETPKVKTKTSTRLAFTLFIVTVVFVLTFFPASLMATQLLGYNQIIFYLYFAHSVVNPAIYAFMSKSFRDSFKQLFCR